ncbi:hypothetical protein CEXT_541731 [Caerostris extrusa]|uniref:Uncharacterized protein n=1 Tax=Caerostris extrusa TaxID=172846 RepID=A0AAV4R5Q1_CAEEX|nr:hypothetical protein CEXT_541731 [Caerostris extrusa]
MHPPSYQEAISSVILKQQCCAADTAVAVAMLANTTGFKDPVCVYAVMVSELHDQMRVHPAKRASATKWRQQIIKSVL